MNQVDYFTTRTLYCWNSKIIASLVIGFSLLIPFSFHFLLALIHNRVIYILMKKKAIYSGGKKIL